MINNKKDIQKLIDSMTLEEKIAQMYQLPGQVYDFYSDRESGPVTGPEGLREYTQDLLFNVGSVLNITEASTARKIQKEYLEQNRLEIPLMFMFDIIHYIVPDCFWNMFSSAADLHRYRTRQLSQYRRPLKVSTSLAFFSRHALLALWNGLPSLLKNELNRTDFRCQLRHHCLNESFFSLSLSLSSRIIILCWYVGRWKV